MLALIEADSLIVSHDPASGAENPAFPQELQPRDRSRDSSQQWVQKTSANLDPDSLGRTSRADTGQPIRCRCVAVAYLEHLVDSKALKPEQAMIQQFDQVGQTMLDAPFKEFTPMADQVFSQIRHSSARLLEDMGGTPGRGILPHASDHAKSWTGGIGGLRRSHKQLDVWKREGKPIPAAWAFHHWSIDSSYLIDRYRKSKWMTDAERESMAAATEVTDKLMRQAFDHPDAVLKDGAVLYRGMGMSEDWLDEIRMAVTNGNPYLISEASFNSNTAQIGLAREFALSSSKRNGTIPVIHKTYVMPGVRGIDIQAVNYYDEAEILIDRGYTREVVAMKRNEDGTVELHSVIKPSSRKLGDGKSRVIRSKSEPDEEGWVEYTVEYPDDAHMNKVSGIAVSCCVATYTIDELAAELRAAGFIE